MGGDVTRPFYKEGRMSMLDIAIIGSGPAALSAAVNCLQRNKTVKVFGRSLDSSLLFTAEKVDNYLGMPHMSGEEILNEFFHHAVKKGVEIQECRITQILPMGEHFMINAENEFIEAKAIIIATGLSKSRSIPGEGELLGKGVSYCATCDGMLYKNKKVVVVGENSEGEEDANFLSEICSHVTYLPQYDTVSHLKENIEVRKGRPQKVEGNDKVTGLVLDGELIECDGAFFIKNTIPPDNLIYGLEINQSSVKVDRSMRTNLKNVYAAGDCTGAPYQIAKAVGEGLIAALSAVSDLDKK